MLPPPTSTKQHVTLPHHHNGGQAYYTKNLTNQWKNGVREIYKRNSQIEGERRVVGKQARKVDMEM